MQDRQVMVVGMLFFTWISTTLPLLVLVMAVMAIPDFNISMLHMHYSPVYIVCAMLLSATGCYLLPGGIERIRAHRYLTIAYFDLALLLTLFYIFVQQSASIPLLAYIGFNLYVTYDLFNEANWPPPTGQ